MSTYIDKMRLWAWRLAVAASLLVAVLTALAGRGLTATVIRTGIAWILIYALAWVSIKLFEQTDVRPAAEQIKGSRLDIAVGLDDQMPTAAGGEADAGAEIKGQTSDTFPGQVTPELAGGLGDAEKQAEIVRRMGWGQQ